MNDGPVARDLCDRALALVVRLLPSRRSDWGRAMQAELAHLDEGRARRRYVLGCTRAVVRDPGAVRTMATHLVVVIFAAAALAIAISIKAAGLRTETIVFVFVLAAIAWAGRRIGPLGPPDRGPARRIRIAGYVVLGAYIMPALFSLAAASPERDQTGVWMFYVALTLYLATVLFATSRRTAVPPRALRLTAMVTAAGLAAWWVPMLLEPSVRAHPAWALVGVAGTIAIALVISTALRWGSRQAAFGAVAAGVATCLLIFLAAQGTYLLAPGLAPDLGRVPGMSAAGEVEQNQAEAIDPYVAELLIGAALGGVLILATIASRGVSRREDQLPVG